MTEALTVAVRAIHFAAVVTLFGEFMFVIAVARRPAHRATAADGRNQLACDRRCLRVAPWALAASMASAVAWLLLQSAAMSGLPLMAALNTETLLAVLGDTLFGRVWIWRMGIALALGIIILGARSSGKRSNSAWMVFGMLLSGGLLTSLAGTGHAAAESGLHRYVHVLADALHLLGAGAWLGGLIPLAVVLANARRGGTHLSLAVAAVPRFSVLGLASVTALVASGAVNTWYTVGSLPGLVGTPYGRLLMAKLLLFACMIALASVNRLWLAPRIAQAIKSDKSSALPPLKGLLRSALAEWLLGLGVLVSVGLLGSMTPALHVQPLWPWAQTLGLAHAASPSTWLALWTGGCALLVSLALILIGVRRQAAVLTVSGTAASLATCVLCAGLFAEPANPTTYFRPRASYDAVSIARGGMLFQRECVACHGAHGHGDGPAAASLPQAPADLTAEHVFHHRAGDLFWWISHGIEGTAMPGFADRISEMDRWNLISFLRAQAQAEQARLPVLAPDFVFQIGDRDQESLAQQRGQFAVLLVLCPFTDSSPRLQELDRAKERLERQGIRIITVATAGETRPGSTILAARNPAIVSAYSIFGRAGSSGLSGAPGTSMHLEFLIDRQGYIRATWNGRGNALASVPELLDRVADLRREASRPEEPETHVHS